MNPTNDVLEQRVAALARRHGGLAVASGHAAEVLALLNLAGAGDNIVSSTSLYGGTWNIFLHTFRRLGIDGALRRAHRHRGLRRRDRRDDQGVVRRDDRQPAARRAGPRRRSPRPAASSASRCSWTTRSRTPYLCRPIEHGAAIVVESLTKWIGGHGTSIGGIIVDGGNFDWGTGRFPQFTEPDASYHGLKFWDVFGDFPGLGNVAFAIRARVNLLRDFGAALSPFNAQQFLLGVETLSLRVQRHSDNALAVAKYLEAHPKVAWVAYPGLESHPTHGERRRSTSTSGYGGVVVFGVKGGLEAGKTLIEQRRAVQPPRQRRRREVAHHPPGVDDALAADRGGARARRVSATTSCGSRSASRTSRTSSPTSSRHWRRCSRVSDDDTHVQAWRHAEPPGARDSTSRARCPDAPSTSCRAAGSQHVDIAYETYGTPRRRARANAVLDLPRALRRRPRRRQRQSATTRDGAREARLVGRHGRPGQGDRHRPLLRDLLQRARRLLRAPPGPARIDPATGKPYGLRFPSSPSRTWSTCRRALLDHLGIEQLLAVVGGSMGGMQALAWAKRYPERVRDVHRRGDHAAPRRAGDRASTRWAGRPSSATRTSTAATTTAARSREQGLADRAHGRPHHVPLRRVDAREVRPAAARPRRPRLRLRHRVRGGELPRLPGRNASSSASTPTRTST